MTPPAPQYEVSGALRRRVMQAVRDEPRTPRSGPRRRLASRRLASRRLTGRGALGLAIALGIAIAIAVVDPAALTPGGGGPRVIRAAVGRAELRIAGGAGELVVDHLPAPPLDRIYELWLQHGTRMPSASTLFAVTSRGSADVGLPGRLSGVTRVLVTLEPEGGSAVPTSAPVILARLPTTD
jgi:anti-sigma-K factor RskA